MEQNKEGRKFTFNFIDLILTLIIAATVITLIYYFTDRDIVASGGKDSTDLTLMVEVTPMREEFRNLVTVGDNVTDTEYSVRLGEVVNVYYSTCYYTGHDSTTGKEIKTKYPGHIAMTLEVKLQTVRGDSCYTVGERELVIDSTVPIRTPSFTGIGKIVSITESSEVK